MTPPPQAREFEFQLPVGYVDGEGQLHSRVVLRKMTGREEAILADRRFQKNGGKLVTELLHSCLVRLGDLPQNGSSTIARMYSADRNFLLLKLRTITFGAELDGRYACPACGETLRHTDNLDELPLRALPEGTSPDDVVVELADGYVDRDGQVHTSVRLRLPTGEDEEIVAAQMRRNASLGKNALLARCLKTLGDVPAHRLEALGARILSELTMTDRRLIDRALNEAAPGVELVRNLECEACGHEFKASLDLTNFLALE